MGNVILLLYVSLQKCQLTKREILLYFSNNVIPCNNLIIISNFIV